MNIKKLNIKHIKPNPNNPRTINEVKLNKLKNSIKTYPQMLELRPLVLNEKHEVLGGNMRLKALNELNITEVPVVYAKDLTPEQEREFIIKDNVGYGEWDWGVLKTEWDVKLLNDWGLELFDKKEKPTEVRKLSGDFVVAPFSILNTREGDWANRKKEWKEIIGDNGESRENLLDEGGIVSTVNSGVSILDPVMAEVVNRWFGVPNGNTFDCFAGDTVFGYVSGYLGNTFTGIELREEQVNLNNERVKQFGGKYICDDGQNVLNHIEENTQDLLFSCPPYYDLEVYSELENDASNQDTYEDFIQILDNAFTNSIKCLKDNRFAVIVVGDVRGKDGYYYDFIGDIKRIFKDNGMRLYNELILVEPVGTLPQRVRRYMRNRKIGKCHQNVLVFFKGDTDTIKEIYTQDYEGTDL